MTRTLMITIDAPSEDLYRQAECRVWDSLRFLPVEYRILPSSEDPIPVLAKAAIQRIVENENYRTWPHRICRDWGEQ